MRIAKLAKLEELMLFDTGITDDSIESLYGLRRLKILGVAGTQVSDYGFTKLREALPDVAITYDLPPWISDPFAESDCFSVGDGKPKDND